jgi:mannose-1-phosphate guanylyltransferase/phosphomannomutase
MNFSRPRARGVFLARRGGLLVTPARGWLEHADEVAIRPRLLPLLRHFSRGANHLFLIGNEEEVAFGKITAECFLSIQERISIELQYHGIEVRRSFACMTHPQSPGSDGKDSVFRMPNVGAFKAAQQEHDLDLASSWLIGERTCEILAADRASVRAALVKTGIGGKDGEFDVHAELVADDAETALRILQLEEQHALR